MGGRGTSRSRSTGSSVRSGRALNGHRCKFGAVVGGLSVKRIVVERRDRFYRFGPEYVQAALAVQGCELVVVDAVEVDDERCAICLES